jgi:flagella basal body P-ring formation protein FlgA
MQLGMPVILGKRCRNMSRIKRAKTGQFRPLQQAPRSDHHGVKKIAHTSHSPRIRASLAATIGLAAGLQAAIAQPQETAPPPAVDAVLAQQLQRLASDSASSAVGNGVPMRVEVELGQLDPRLKLAPCEQIHPYLPTGVRPYGRTRIGLRCVQGPTHWNVYLPVTVKLFTQALVASSALPAGTLLEAQHLQRTEVDVAASPDPAITAAPLAVGRTLARPLSAGDTLRRGDLKARQYFSAGDVVRIVAVGSGYSVSAEGQAITAGVEGQPARVRVESGRILSGLPSGDRRMEIAL